MLRHLMGCARELGHHTIIASISADQVASVQLHLSEGFVEAARLREVGFKFDRWLDVVYLQYML
jgi:phosphinothricin acetyltransferase